MTLNNQTGFHLCVYENGCLTVKYIPIPVCKEITVKIPYSDFAL